MRTVLVLVLVAGCKPGMTAADELCARAAAIYDRCESHDGTTAQQWELTIDRWRGLCRAALTGQTKQLLPDGLVVVDPRATPLARRADRGYRLMEGRAQAWP